MCYDKILISEFDKPLFGSAAETCSRRSPSPRPSPLGRGRHIIPLSEQRGAGGWRTTGERFSLSLGERENWNLAHGINTNCGLVEDWRTILPLPWGEGRGEGERGVPQHGDF